MMAKRMKFLAVVPAAPKNFGDLVPAEQRLILAYRKICDETQGLMVEGAEAFSVDPKLKRHCGPQLQVVKGGAA